MEFKNRCALLLCTTVSLALERLDQLYRACAKSHNIDHSQILGCVVYFQNERDFQYVIFLGILYVP